MFRPLALALLLLAGCVQSTGSPDAGRGLVGEDTGAITGSVLNEELLPLAIGNVSVAPVEDNTSVQVQDLGPEGTFQFGQLRPGVYRVTAQVDGYYSRDMQTEVKAGETSSVRLLLPPRPSHEPYVIVTAWAGFNPCGFALILTPANICDQRISNVTSGGPPQTGRNYTIPDGFAAVVGETTWRGADEASAYYYNRSQERKNRNESASIFSAVLDVAQGKNPLRVFLIPGQQRENSTQGVLASYYGKVSEGGAFEMRYAVWWNGYYGDNFQALNPVCNQFAVPKCTGVGATISFRFTHWLSVFMYDRPGDIKNYSVVPDA